MLPRLQASILLLLFVSLAGCAIKEPASIFSTIPAGKTTLSTTRFQLIDDFNAGVSKTRLGTEWEIQKDNSGTKIELLANQEDAVRHGGSLSIEYTIPAYRKGGFSVLLNGLDASQARFLVFLVHKAEFESFPGEIFAALRDSTGKEAAVEIKRLTKRPWMGPHSEWVETAIPKAAYPAIDFSRLDRLQIFLIASSGEVKGKLVLDEVAFFGPEELVFKSDQDNLIGFPKEEISGARRDQLLKIRDDKQFLLEISRDTWRYFENLIDRETNFVVDHIRMGQAPGVGSYVNPTNVGLYWLASVAAYDLSLISKEQAIRNIQSSLDAFEKLERWNSGFWYNYYHTHNRRITRKYVSVADNGWLAAALVVIRQAFPETFGDQASKLLKKLDFFEFYDASNGQLKLGFDGDKGIFSPYHYGLLATEARLASYVAIGKGDLENEHWARIYRTLPVEWDWQKQIPQGSEQTLFDLPVFEGFYTYLGRQYVPSWGGSLFEFLSPTLLLKEQELAPKGLGKNNEIVTDLHIKYALHEKGYPVWGMAPCAVRNGKYWIYREYGVPQLGAKGYPDRGVIAPYASFLALATRPEAAIRNLREILLRYPDVYGAYGFYDSVDVMKGIVNHQYLALDQAMSFLAIVNYVQDGGVRKRFHADPIGQKAEVLLREETFSVK